jgi:pimeloyl-ACP methyl ester carboxylesterase
MADHSIGQWRDMSLKSINGMLNEQVQQYLHNIEIPVLVIFGEQDRLIPNTLIHFGETPEGIAKKATALFPQGTYKLIKYAGHFVQMEKGEEVNRLIGDWLIGH